MAKPPRQAERKKSRRPATSLLQVAERQLRKQAKRAIELLESWSRDDSGYDEQTWPKLKRALERQRLSSRRLFHA